MKNIVSTITTAILAGAWAWFSIGVGSIGGVTLHTWPVYIFWALFFVAGANKEGTVKLATTAIWGPVWGWLTVFIGMETLGPVIGVPLAMGLTITVLVAAICIMGDIPFFSFTAGAYSGWAIYFGTGFDLVGSIVVLLIAVVIGLLSVYIPTLFTKKDQSAASISK